MIQGIQKVRRFWGSGRPGRPRRAGGPGGPDKPAPPGKPGHPHRTLILQPDGRTLASAHDDHAVRLWNVADPRRPEALDTLTGPTAAVRSVAFSPDGHTLAAGGDDEKVRLWDAADPRRPEPVGAPLAGHSGLVHPRLLFAAPMAAPWPAAARTTPYGSGTSPIPPGRSPSAHR
ncbi:hypothetical protein STENM327S_01218 [Streptomyces tendae]